MTFQFHQAMSSSLIKKACARLWRLFQKRIMLFLAPLVDRLTLKDQRILDEHESFPKPLRGKASTSSLIPRPVPLICTDVSCRARSEFDCSAEFEPCLLLWFQYHVWSGLGGSYSAVYWESIEQVTSLLVAHWLFQILFLWLLNSVYKLSTCFCTTAWKLLTVYLMQVSCHLTPSKAASSPNLCFSMYSIG